MPKIRNKKNGSLDEVTDAQWADMHKVEAGMSRSLASLFDLVSPQPMPEEVRLAMESVATEGIAGITKVEPIKPEEIAYKSPNFVEPKITGKKKAAQN